MTLEVEEITPQEKRQNEVFKILESLRESNNDDACNPNIGTSSQLIDDDDSPDVGIAFGYTITRSQVEKIMAIPEFMGFSANSPLGNPEDVDEEERLEFESNREIYVDFKFIED